MELYEYANPCLSDSSSKKLDRWSIEKWGFSGQTLMGMAANSMVQKNFESWKHFSQILILSGSGNNGGDGLAIAFLLWERGLNPRVFRKEGEHTEEYIFYLELCKKVNIEILPLESERFRTVDFSQKTLVIDSLLGIGFRPPLREPYYSVLEVIRKKRMAHPNTFLFSIDTMSGFDPEDQNPILPDELDEIGIQKIQNVYLSPDKTKRSLLSIGFPIREYLDENPAEIQEWEWTPLPREVIEGRVERDANSNKYTNGSLSLLGGSDGMSGAIISSQSAFHRLGGGISMVFTKSQDTVQSILDRDPSRMVFHLTNEKLEDHSFFQKSKVFLAGPGLSSEDLESLPLPKDKICILDAGAFTNLDLDSLHENCILTPHLGEFQKLTGQKYPNEKKSIDAAKEFAQTHKTNVLLKGSHTVLCIWDGTVYHWNRPNPKLAVMGSGDLLVGLLAVFLARGNSLPESVLFSLSLMDLSRNMELAFPTAGEILEYLSKEV